MGRCQSTPGLVETKGQTPIEEMWLCQSAHTASTYYNPQSLFRYIIHNPNISILCRCPIIYMRHFNRNLFVHNS